ncbi:hypothetical protein D3C87_1786510 [compost metagenome]
MSSVFFGTTKNLGFFFFNNISDLSLRNPLKIASIGIKPGVASLSDGADAILFVQRMTDLSNNEDIEIHI